jgi:hypothetical protein
LLSGNRQQGREYVSVTKTYPRKSTSTSRDQDHSTEKSNLRQPKNLVSHFKAIFTAFCQTLNRATKLHTKGLWSLRRNGIVAISLEQIHAIEAKRFNLHYGLALGGSGLWDVGEKEGRCWALAIFDVWVLLEGFWGFCGRHMGITDCSHC